jgi:signal transduction histidine kinase
VTVHTIRGRIVLAIVVVGCIPLLTCLILAYMSGMRSLRDVIGGNFQTIAAQAADRVTMLVQGEIQRVRLLASAPLRIRQPVELANRSYPGDPSKVSVLLQDRARAWEQSAEAAGRLLNTELSRFLLETKVRDGDKMVGILITDRHGALVAATSEPDHYLFGDELWWKTIQSGGGEQVYLSGLIAGRGGSFSTPEETIDVAVPIFDDHQRIVIGAIKVSYRFDTLFAIINQIRIGQTGHAMLFSADGQPLICPILPRQAHRIPAPLMTMIVSDDPGWGIAEDDGHGARDTVVGFAPVPGLGAPGNSWHVFVRQQPAESYAPIRDQLRNLAIIGFVMIGLLWAIGRYVATRIARPIHTLKAGVEAISHGTYGGPLDIRTGDEFEELASAVHRMADRLNASHTEMEALNSDLTRRVEEKTTEVTRHMKQLHLSERLATLGKMASGIAHEINNPLGIMLNRIECIEAEAAELHLPAEMQRDLLAIRSKADRINRITKSMLALSHGSATTLKPIDLNCVIRSCADMARERAAAQGVRIESSALSPDMPAIMGDRDRLETVFLNLINNAIDAARGCDDGGVVTIQSHRMRRDREEWATVEVIDNGPGIPEDILGRIFDPFFTTKDVGQGTGLGLFLSYGIVADHRGRLEVANGEAGAVASVILPALNMSSNVSQEAGWDMQAKY